jgi:hypothetical protein
MTIKNDRCCLLLCNVTCKIGWLIGGSRTDQVTNSSSLITQFSFTSELAPSLAFFSTYGTYVDIESMNGGSSAACLNYNRLESERLETLDFILLFVKGKAS